MESLNLLVSSATLIKLRDRHKVSRREIEQCFENLDGGYLLDDREEHRTDPPTLWFVANTNTGRNLKVVFIFLDGNIHIKSAYEPAPAVVAMYQRKARQP